MSRDRGAIHYSSFFEVLKAAPLDARMVVGYYADLVNPATWEESPGYDYTYIGMPVYVTLDTEELRGLYVLDAADYTNPNNWKKIGSGDVSLEYVDGSLAQRDSSITYLFSYVTDLSTDLSYWKTYVDASLVDIRDHYIPDVSLSDDFKWINGKLYVDASVAGLSEIYDYIDATLGLRDASIEYLFQWDYAKDASIRELRAADATLYQYIDATLGHYVRDTSIGEGLYWNELTSQWDVSVEGGGGIFDGDVSTSHVWYDTELDPNTTMEIDVGGIKAGTTAGELYGQNLTKILNDLLFPTLNPQLSAPNGTFTSSQTGLKEIGETLNINFTATLNRGSITPPYGTSGFRSGLPNTYTYTGTGLPASVASSSSPNNQTVNGYVVLSGTQSWSNTISYDAGEQPKDSKGGDFDNPLPPGTTSVKSVSITGVYPYYATTENMDTSTKQPLASMTASYWQINMAGEVQVGNKKQKAWFPQAFKPITGIQQFNPNNNQWDWVNLTQANSLATFTKTPLQINLHGNMVDYWLYEHNGDLVGARDLRFYTT